MNKFIAYCGLNCEKCDAYIATKNNDQELRERTANNWSKLNNTTIKASDINCEGCKLNGCKTVFCESLCPIRICAQEKGFETCLDCENIYNCEKIKPIIENSDALNNLKNNK